MSRSLASLVPSRRVDRSWRAVGLALGLAVAASSSAHAELLAGWNFNLWNPDTDWVVAADHGSGSIDLTAVGSGLSAFAGTSVNAVDGDIAGSALSLVGQSQNGRSIYIVATTGGADRLSISFAARRTDSGFADNRIDAWVAGAWVQIGSFAAGSDWPVHEFEFDAPTALFGGVTELRITFDGATSGTGNIRLDNIRIESRAVPAPGAAALLAIAGCVARRRRR